MYNQWPWTFLRWKEEQPTTGTLVKDKPGLLAGGASEHHACSAVPYGSQKADKPTPVGFEPTRGDPIGLAGRRLSRSAKVSML